MDWFLVGSIRPIFLFPEIFHKIYLVDFKFGVGMDWYFISILYLFIASINRDIELIRPYFFFSRYFLSLPFVLSFLLFLTKNDGYYSFIFCLSKSWGKDYIDRHRKFKCIWHACLNYFFLKDWDKKKNHVGQHLGLTLSIKEQIPMIISRIFHRYFVLCMILSGATVSRYFFLLH